MYVIFRYKTKIKILVKYIMTFTKEDFTQETATRLNVIIMKKMEQKPLTRFYTLPQALKAKHTRLLNEYISTLPEDWEEKLLSDFNTIVLEDVLTEDFDPSKEYVKDCNTERQLIISPEQQAWIDSEEAEGRTVKII
jgi:hypothetical protein